MSRIVFLAAVLLLVSGCRHPAPPLAPRTVSETGPASGQRYLFGWGYQDSQLAQPRGGMTQGTEVRLAPPRPDVVRGDSAFEKDRAAILALAGDYKVSFHFLETLGLLPEYRPASPYFSWATERVHVLEDRGDFVSLQHTLVMFFTGPDGQVEGPMVTKHWRQDWSYQETEYYLFRGERTWARERRSPEEVEGAWSQAVFQVDDSPRYQAVGRWEHQGNRSQWRTERDWRPLPRREFSVRSDYDILEGRHQIVLTPSGWVHRQDNWKRVSADDGSGARYLAQEAGINRYQRLIEPDLSAAEEFWARTGPYWAAVRQVWAEVMAERESFQVKPSVNGQKLFEAHFEYASRLEEGEPYNPAEGLRHARETIGAFIEQ